MAIVKYTFEETTVGKVDLWATKMALYDIFPSHAWGVENNKFWFKEEEAYLKQAQQRILELRNKYLDSRFVINFTSIERYNTARGVLLKNKIFFENISELKLLVAVTKKFDKAKIIALIKEAVRASEEVTI